MAIYWDTCTVTFKNDSNRPMTFSKSEVNTGFIAGDPTASVKNGEQGDFKGSSTSGLLSGCGGTVTYSLNDGTLVNMTYWVAYPYGPADNSYYQVGFQGANANRYAMKDKVVKTNGSHGGAGKDVIWTFTIAPA